MFCPNCGKDVSDGSPFCDGCGYSFTNNGGGYQDQYQYSYQNSFSGQPGSYGGDANQLVNQFSKQNSRFIVDGEEILARGRWNLIPFIISSAIGLLLLIFFYRQVQVLLSIPFQAMYMLGGYSENGWMRFIGGLFNLYQPFKAPLFWILIVVYIFVRIGLGALFFARRELVITNKKVYARVGLIGTKQHIIPISKINYSSVRYSIIGRLINSAKFFVFPGTFIGIGFNYLSNAQEIQKVLENATYKATR